jgi:hypothetical protein
MPTFWSQFTERTQTCPPKPNSQLAKHPDSSEPLKERNGLVSPTIHYLAWDSLNLALATNSFPWSGSTWLSMSSS